MALYLKQKKMAVMWKKVTGLFTFNLPSSLRASESFRGLLFQILFSLQAGSF